MSPQEQTAIHTVNGSGLERPRYFACQLVTAADLTLDQDYFRAKLRRHNRLLHGWGVVCGAMVKKGAKDNEIVVERGYVLGPYGDEIFIHTDVTVNIEEALAGTVFSSTGEETDPWCRDAHTEPPGDQGLRYVAVRYVECQTDPQPVGPVGHGCDDLACEPSRVRDGFAIELLTDLPTTHDPMPKTSLTGTTGCIEELKGGIQARACPKCPPEPWVILADVVLGEEGDIAKLDNYTHRRYVASFADYYFLCPPQPSIPLPYGVLEEPSHESSVPPATLVQVNRKDGSPVYLPGHFEVRAGESYADLLTRERDREFYDPVSEETFTLGELYAMAGASASETVRGIADALAPLEGLRIETAKLREARIGLEPLLDKRGVRRLDRKHLASPARASTLPATDIHGVSPRSQLGKRLADMTIGDIAGMSLEDFLALAREGVAERRLRSVERQAEAIWDRATEVDRIARAWRNQA
jgi:hypothetical protein